MVPPLFVNANCYSYFPLQKIATSAMHSVPLLNQEEPHFPISNPQFALQLLPFSSLHLFIPTHTHTRQTYSAYPSYCSMIIHMGVFPDDDLGVLQLLCQEQGIQTKSGQEPLPPVSLPQSSTGLRPKQE